jgi:hypothetical protein
MIPLPIYFAVIRSKVKVTVTINIIFDNRIVFHDNFSSVYWIFTKLGHMILLWKGKNPIYFGVITIIPFDNLYRQVYFVMHTFLVLLAIVLSVLLRYIWILITPLVSSTLLDNQSRHFLTEYCINNRTSLWMLFKLTFVLYSWINLTLQHGLN